MVVMTITQTAAPRTRRGDTTRSLARKLTPNEFHSTRHPRRDGIPGPAIIHHEPIRDTDALRRLRVLAGLDPWSRTQVSLVQYGEGKSTLVRLFQAGFGKQSWSGENALAKALADADQAIRNHYGERTR